MKLHIGGQQPHPDWKILDIAPGPYVDFLGDCQDLSQFATGSIDEIYVSHVLEHLSHRLEMGRALYEFHRVLRPGGRIYISVPDFFEACRAFCAPDLTTADRFKLARTVFGGQRDAFDVHKFGFSEDILRQILMEVGFRDVRRVESFNMFDDGSAGKLEARRHDGSICETIDGMRFSINVVAGR